MDPRTTDRTRKGRLIRGGSAEPTGVAWLDEEGEDVADARVFRSRLLRRVLGVRVHAPAGDGDLVLVSTRRSRVLATPVPYETDTGPVVLGAEPLGPNTHVLSWRRPAGSWHAFAVLRLDGARDAEPLPFDPVRRQVPGLRRYPTGRLGEAVLTR